MGSWKSINIYNTNRKRKIPGHQLREVEGSLSAKKRMRLALLLGASDLNFSNTVSKFDTVASNCFIGILDFEFLFLFLEH